MQIDINDLYLLLQQMATESLDKHNSKDLATDKYLWITVGYSKVLSKLRQAEEDGYLKIGRRQ